MNPVIFKIKKTYTAVFISRAHFGFGGLNKTFIRFPVFNDTNSSG